MTYNYINKQTNTAEKFTNDTHTVSPSTDSHFPNHKDFPNLTTEQKQCVSHFTSECLHTLNEKQLQIYNSLISSPSENNIRLQDAYNNAVVS